MRDLDLVIGDGTLPNEVMTVERWTTVENGIISADTVPTGFDISTGCDPSLLSR